ncbi:MAG: TIGR04211 family SH3 domain-containing protein [Gammaproteobacteria bacterium]|nr:TIGR04211 family SH3 domain-containing protein [Gammaproteobacteria bacterium]
MLKFFSRFAIVMTLLCSGSLYAASGHISDNIYIFFHSGPGTNFKILGSLTAGTPIEILKQSDDGQFNKIKDPKGRTGWVKSSFTSSKNSLRVRYDNLQDKLSAIEQQASSSSNSLEQALAKVANLEQSLKQSSDELIQAKNSERLALSKLEGEDAHIRMQWLINGGVLVGFSILFGIALTFLPKKKKKSSGNWS